MTVAAAPELDAITREVLANAFKEIAEEMAVVEYRSSFSPVIRDMLDFCCAIFDGKGRMLASSEMIPAQLGLMHFALGEALADFGGAMDPGDVCICNHPYRGGSHTPDVQIFTPIHVDAELIGYAGSIAHHIDIGGRVPGTRSARNTELFQEGILLPPVKLVEGGRRVEPLWATLRANVRDPHRTLGDLEAQIAACRRGSLRLAELVGRFSVAQVTAAMDALLEETSQRTQAVLRSWPDTVVEVEGFMDHDGFDPSTPIRVAARVQARDGELYLDFDGTSPQVPGALNVPWASTHAGAYFAVRAFLGDEVPHNEGMMRHIHVSAPEGTILRPKSPAAVSARHLTVQRQAEVLCRALGELLPDRAVASSHASFPSIVMRATDPRSGRVTLLSDMVGGGGGARRDAPGDSGIDTYTSNCACLPAEVAELEYPWRVERVALVDGSGGAGRHQGGMAIRRDYRLLADEALVTYYLEQSDPRFASAGAEGGGPGGSAAVRVRRAGTDEWTLVEASKGELRLRRGDAISFQSAGGGGFGPPDAGPQTTEAQTR
ncbi:MAG TPA: hydantoinase B/oxoprolinase family protein [Capillimicrobium sp.]|nr:hydantoinase B/oxoprolinase family protein [Capillimicrobium sp.]